MTKTFWQAEVQLSQRNLFARVQACSVAVAEVGFLILL